MSWLTINSKIDSIVFGVWYKHFFRGEVGFVIACEAEWRHLTNNIFFYYNCVIYARAPCKMLRYSASDSIKGTSLYMFCFANN